jgi:transposase
MGKRYHINEKQVEEIEKARKKNKDKNIEKRLKALVLHSEGKKREEIATETGFVKTYISELVSKYCNGGIGSVTENKQQGNHRNLSYAEEAAILALFDAKASVGQVIEVKEIKLSYEAKLGRELNSNGHIYSVLKRHGWRKVMPRSKHPNKASDEVIEASKKLTQPSEMR